MTATVHVPRSRGDDVGHTRSRSGFWLVAGIYALTMLGGTLPIPLYVLWAPRMGFGAFSTTLIFATYALGTVLALLVASSASDQAGRRPVMAASLLTAAASTGLFLVAGNVEMLLIARFVSGLATGVMTATATAALRELGGETHDRKVSTVSTAANMGGLGLGVIVAGAFAEWAPDPTHTIFWVYLASLVPAQEAVALTPETVSDRRRPTLPLHRPTLPDALRDRADFLRLAAVVFAAFAVTGLFSSLIPAFLATDLHVTNLALTGLVVGMLFLVALAAQVVTPPRVSASPLLFSSALIGGITLVELGLWTRALPEFLAGTVLAGIGVGVGFRRGVTGTQRLASPAHRADLISTYFLAAYAGTIVPTLALGLLDEVLSRDVSTLILAVGVVIVTAVATGTHRQATAT